MNEAREIKRFLFGVYFSDGLRITLGVLLPSLVLAQFGLLMEGITVSLGAFAVSIADTPGPPLHKRNAMLISMLLIAFTALITGFINTQYFFMMIGIAGFCFFFSMLTVYGERASNIGTACLLVMVLSIDKKLDVNENLVYAASLVSGGLWYFLLSTGVLKIRPYRMAQQVLGNCINDVAAFLKIKSDFYDLNEDYDSTYKKLLNQQITVNQNLDSVREILFKTQQIVKESTPTGRRLVLIFIDVVDLYEQTMATHYDYQKIRESFKTGNSLYSFKTTLVKIAEELENMSYYITGNENPRQLHNFSADLEQLKYAVDKVEMGYRVNNLVLKKILVNIRNIVNRIQKVYNYFEKDSIEPQQLKNIDVDQFVSHQDYEIKVFKENLSYSSAIFRHSARVTVVCLIGYLISIFLPFGHHSYWILLTILVILKPGFSLTKQRNIQRIVGTFAGGIIGALIVFYIKDEIGRFSFLLFFMIGTYSFLRQNYIVGVLFMTPYIIILFSFLGLGGIGIAEERIFDTMVGSVIAFTASYYVFPAWEYKHIKGFMQSTLVANYDYLLQAAYKLSGKPPNITEYKLARKEVYISSANLASAFQRMLSEPKSKQKEVKDIHKFVVLNHMLSSYTATLLANLGHKEIQTQSTDLVKIAKKALFQLAEAAQKLTGEKQLALKEINLQAAEVEFIKENRDAKFISEELDFVLQTCNDINKISRSIKL